MNEREAETRAAAAILFRRRARAILSSFLLTFVAARLTVFLIAVHRIPALYLYLDGIHFHHFGYGILLLSGVGAYLLLFTPTERSWRWTTVLYGAGLALTFDEFGMWLHLGGSYWQRASFDAIVAIAALLCLISIPINGRPRAATEVPPASPNPADL